MRINIRTRGRTTDYTFLGEAPASSWWSDFGASTSFERPTLLLVSDEQGIRCFLSGIPSTTRRDRVGSVIRYTLVLTYGEADREQEQAGILKLVQAFLEMAAGGQAGRLSAVLDKHFDEECVERLINSGGDESACEVECRLKGMLEDIPLPAASGAASLVDKYKYWMGLLSSAKVRTAFVQRVTEILELREQGLAAHLNLIGALEDAERFVCRYPSIALLVKDSPDIRSDRPVSFGNPPPTPAPRPPDSAIRRISMPVLLGGVLLLLGVIGIWLLTKGPGPAHPVIHIS